MVYDRAGYHRGDVRAALLRAVLNLARDGGPPAVTLRAAAREVGITAAAVHRHFTTVEELLAAVKCRSLRMPVRGRGRSRLQPRDPGRTTNG